MPEDDFVTREEFNKFKETHDMRITEILTKMAELAVTQKITNGLLAAIGTCMLAYVVSLLFH